MEDSRLGCDELSLSFKKKRNEIGISPTKSLCKNFVDQYTYIVMSGNIVFCA